MPVSYTHLDVYKRQGISVGKLHALSGKAVNVGSAYFGGCLLYTSSRFGRDYLTVGQYTDIIFPSYDVRFIAVNDGVDSQCGDGEGFAAIRNLFNEWYPRDTSKKVRISPVSYTHLPRTAGLEVAVCAAVV